jgi:hypothetical protein
MSTPPRLAGALILVVALAVAASAEAAGCDRACLVKTLDRYMAAVVKHDPGAAPLAAGFRYTENALEVHPGDGIWKTATGLGTVQRHYLDAVSGQAAYFGTIEEGATTGIATLRIKVVNERITEGELVIGRSDNGLFDLPGLVASPPPMRTVPASARTSRETLVKAANSYFDGLESKDGSRILGIPGCMRVENGSMVTGMRAGRAGGAPVDRGDCTNMSAMGQISTVVTRRFPIVDEEAGAVVGFGIFNRPPGAKRADGTLWPRNLLTEVFTIDDGRIQAIHAAMHYMTPDVANAPGWPADAQGR